MCESHMSDPSFYLFNNRQPQVPVKLYRYLLDTNHPLERRVHHSAQGRIVAGVGNTITYHLLQAYQPLTSFVSDGE